METFGAYIKAQREEKGIRLEEIASITKIHIHALQHLEAGRWQKLPPDPFLRGFVIAYAKYVGLDMDDCLNRYTEERDGPVEVPVKKPGDDRKPKLTDKEAAAKLTAKRREVAAPPAQKTATNRMITESTSLPLGRMAGFAAAFLLIGVISGLIYVGKNSSEPSAPLVVQGEVDTSTDEELIAEARKKDLLVDLKLRVEEPEEVASQTNSVPAVTPTPSPLIAAKEKNNTREAAAVVPVSGHKVVVEGLARTWMKVIIDDNAPIEYFLPKGKSAGYAANKRIKVVVGDRNGVRVTHNSEEVSGKKLRGNVAVFEYPSNASFPQEPGEKRDLSPIPDNLP